MRIRSWVCRGMWITALYGALLAGCGGETGVDGESSEPSESESVSEASPTDAAPVETESDSGQPPTRVSQLALGCTSTSVNWSQVRTTAWNGNTSTLGTYQCYGTLSATSSGFTVSATLTSSDRTGSAQYTCSNGTWLRKSGTCDGAIISTTSASGVTTTCSSADLVRQMWINWFLEDLKRCAGTAGLDWWVDQYNNNTNCLASNNYNGYPNKDACWRAQFRAAANVNGNSYNEAQATGHVSAWDESYLCGSLAYTWVSPSVYGTTCKYRP
jgi:hypothetical protein